MRHDTSIAMMSALAAIDAALNKRTNVELVYVATEIDEVGPDALNVYIALAGDSVGHCSRGYDEMV